MPTLRLKAELVEAPRPVVRTLDVPVETTLYGLHLVLQAAFFWHDSHLHEFTQGERRWSPVPEEFEALPEAGVLLSELLHEIGDELTYTYDFGDNWRHRLTLVGTDRRARKRATLVDGQGAAPLEDCGGVGGWERVLDDIDLAAQGKFDKLANPAGYELTFGDDSPAAVQAHFASFGEVDRHWASVDVKKVDVAAEPEDPGSLENVNIAELVGAQIRDMVETQGLSYEEAIAMHNQRMQIRNLPELGEDLAFEQAAFEDPEVARRLYERAQERGVLGALGDYFGTPLLTEMIHRHETASAPTEEHLALIGGRMQDVLRAMMEKRSMTKVMRKVFAILGIGTDEEDIYWAWNQLEFLFVTSGVADARLNEFVVTEDTVKVLALDKPDFAREIAARIPGDQGEPYITAVLVLLLLAYGDDSMRSLGALRGHTPDEELAVFFSAIIDAYFPVAPSIDGEGQRAMEFFERFSLLREALHLVMPPVSHPFDPNSVREHPALVSFAKECLSSLDARWLLPFGVGESRYA